MAVHWKETKRSQSKSLRDTVSYKAYITTDLKQLHFANKWPLAVKLPLITHCVDPTRPTIIARASSLINNNSSSRWTLTDSSSSRLDFWNLESTSSEEIKQFGDEGGRNEFCIFSTSETP
ncbi:hypothetical protein J6590_004508 [Homalodisca vitripennis]|nr:hypothetical protein J6590_004508 [Homalodisca vitripennis]